MDKDNEQSTKSDAGSLPEEKPIILGMGTGRCGTNSLANIIRAAGVSCSHELLWENSRSMPLAWGRKDIAIEKCEGMMGRPGDLVGDVALYWLPVIPALRERFSDVRSVALQRDKETCLPSFRRKIPPGVNHWVTGGEENYWDQSFPNTGAEGDDFFECVSRYYDLYYEMCKELDVPIFPMHALNSKDGVLEIFDHLGISDPKMVAFGTRVNITRT